MNDSSDATTGFVNTPQLTSSQDNKGAWLKVSQNWQIPIDQNALFSYRIASDSRHFFLGMSPFAAGPTAALRGYDGASGHKLWDVSFPDGIIGYPISSDGVVVQAAKTRGHAGELVAFDAATGTERWRHLVESPSTDDQGTPGTFLSGVFYYADGEFDVWGIDAMTGAVKYHHTSQTSSYYQSPQLANDKLVINAPQSMTLFGIKKDLTQAWSHHFTDDGAPDYVRAFGDTIVAVKNSDTSKSAVVWAFNADDGRQMWKATTIRVSHVTMIDNVVAVMGFQSDKRAIVGLDSTNGRQVWTNEAQDSLDREFLTVADGTLFAAGHSLEIIDPKSGATTFHLTQKFGVTVPPAATAGRVVAPSADAIYGFN